MDLILLVPVGGMLPKLPSGIPKLPGGPGGPGLRLSLGPTSPVPVSAPPTIAQPPPPPEESSPFDASPFDDIPPGANLFLPKVLLM